LINDLTHLCFDKDGVLIDVHEYWKHTTELRADYIIKKFDLTSSDRYILINNMGINVSSGKIKKSGPVGYKPRPIIVKKVKNTLSQFSINISKNKIEKYFVELDADQQKRNDYKIKLLSGVKNFLDINESRYKMTIFTSDRKMNALIALKNCGIENYFDLVLGGDSVNNQKPNPEGILKACSGINISPNNTAYISDTCSDLEMAESANINYKVGLLTGLGRKKELIKTANLVCNNLTDLLHYLY